MEHITDFDRLYQTVSQSLHSQGVALIHSMFQTTRKKRAADPFLAKYIFPGGGIPQLQNNINIFRKHFQYVDVNELPQKSYPKTIHCWYKTFCQNEDKIRKLLTEKGKVKDVDFAVRIFKHYLVSVYC